MDDTLRKPGRDADGNLRPWEKPGNLRRDLAPHRSHLLAVLGLTSLFFGFSSFFLTFPALLAVPIGWYVARQAEIDLHRMRSGTVDPEGRSLTVRAGLWGNIGFWTGIGLWWVPLAVFWVLA
jgi:hypothetical protein